MKVKQVVKVNISEDTFCYTVHMLYTRKGDDGTTKDFVSRSGERKSKSSCQMEALGALDELNSFLGLVKVRATSVSWFIDGKNPADIISSIQNNLFTIQAEIAGADKHIVRNRVVEMEMIIDAIERELPPITTFLISGGTELSALFDVSRTLARKSERRIIACVDAHELRVGEALLAYTNRLSSLLYAMARLSTHKSGIKEGSPDYR